MESSKNLLWNGLLIFPAAIYLFDLLIKLILIKIYLKVDKSSFINMHTHKYYLNISFYFDIH